MSDAKRDRYLDDCDAADHDSQKRRRLEDRHTAVSGEDRHPEPSSLAQMPRERSTPTDTNEYTVGWVCAVTTEYVAAQAFLDEKHSPLAYQDANDNNIYTLGRIGKHNVVVACLPHRNYGLVNAATVAQNMMRTFTNIRFGLMVGIGGGVPSPHDIRLGDIVVSSVDNEKGAVLQYNFGHTVQNKTFKMTKHLDAPPLLLQGAVQDLVARYELQGNRIDQAIDAVLAKNPRLKKYGRPDPTSDRLYKSSIVHKKGLDGDCATDCGLGDAVLVQRAPRTELDDDPKVHYGLIASADQLMKDAKVRDRLAREKGVLCFEMEAAGLMNAFRCLVVRGICDYSDSHKNNDWQGYAAMAAAAYAKDLLNSIPPGRVQAEQKMIKDSE